MNDHQSTSRAAAKTRPLTIAVLLIALAVLLQTGAAAYRAHIDKQALQAAIAKQTAAVSETRKVRQQLNAITGKTVKLAQQGNQNAAKIIEKMQAAGVNFSSGDQ